LLCFILSHPEPIVELPSKAVVAINLLELLAKSLFSFGWREQVLKLCDGLAHLHFVAGVVPERNAELPSHFSQLGNCEMVILVEPSSGPAEGRLEGERVYELEFLPHNYPPCRFLLLLDLEIAEIKVEELSILMEQQGENPLFQAVRSLIRASVHE
jgi:hypothetical protein